MNRRFIFCITTLVLCMNLLSQELSYTVTPSFTDYASSFGGTIAITNTGTQDINDWVLEMDWAETFTVWSATKESNENHHVIKNAGWNKTIGAGKTLKFGINGSGARTSVPTNIVVKEGSGGTPVKKKPSKPVIRTAIDPFGKTEFTVEWNIYAGTAGESWELHEDDGSGYKLIGSPVQLSSVSVPQSDSKLITDKTYGVYKYKVKVSNSHGSSWSDETFINIGGASKIGISYGSVDVSKQALQVIQPIGTSEYSLETADNPSPIYSVSTNNPNVLSASVLGSTLKVEAKKSGRAGIKIIDTVTGEIRHIGVKVKKADGALPGLPEYLSIGSVGTNVERDLNFVKDFQEGDKNKFMDVRYVYLNGEPDSWNRPVDGWQNWGANIRGHRAFTFIRENMKLGIIPFFVYYTICGSNESYATDLKNIQDEKHLGYYFKDLKFTLDTIRDEAMGEVVGMVFEPDFIGYMMQQSKKQPHEIYANTKLVYEKAFGGDNAVGILDSSVDLDPETNQPFADNLYGLVSAINYLVNKYNTTQGTSIKYGWQFNLWSNAKQGVPAKGLMHKTEEVGVVEGQQFISETSRETAEYYIAAGILRFNPHFISIDKYGKDAASFVGDTNPAGDPANSTWFWNADNWNNYLLYTKVLHETTNKPVVLWQLPVGHVERSQALDPYDGPLFDPLTNTTNGAECFYEDSSTSFFFGDTFKPGSQARLDWFKLNAIGDPLVNSNGDSVTWGSHFEAAKNSGIMMALFGAGVGEATHGNVSDVSDAVKPEDDMWFFVHTQRYIKNPVMLEPPVEDKEPPSVPSGLTLVSKTDKKATISWDASTDNVAVAGYVPNLDGVDLSSTVGTTLTLENLTPLTNYTLKVKAFDASQNNSEFSSSLSFTTEVEIVDIEDPTDPSSITAVDIQKDSLVIEWVESTDNVGVIGYNIYVNGSLEQEVLGETVTLSGLTPATLYVLEVEAKDEAGNKSAKVQESFTTLEDLGDPEWTLGDTYQAGDTVTYQNKKYVALVTHTAHSQSWNPKDSPTLWSLVN